MKLGGAFTELKDLWNVSAPDKVLQVARSYVEAGARIVLSRSPSPRPRSPSRPRRSRPAAPTVR